MKKLKLNNTTRKILALLFFVMGVALFFNKGFLNFDYEHPFRSLMAAFLLSIIAAIAIIFGSRDPSEKHQHAETK
jgi:drug/metabolite transporter (DMT)-like permease